MIDTIGLDIDGIIFDWIGSVKREAVKQLGLDPAECTAQPDHWGLPWMDGHWDWYEENLPAIFGHGRTYPGAKDGVDKIRYLCDTLILISHVPKAGRDARMNWLQSSGLYSRVDDVYLLDMDKPKSTVPGVSLYIDDADHVHDEVTAAGKNILLVDRSWNKHVNAKYRVRSWPQIVKWVDYHNFQNTFS